MDAGLTAEQVEIRRTLRELLHKRCGPEELRAAVDTPAGHDPVLWTALSDQLGLPGLALPERFDGVGGSVTELTLAAEELGRALAPTPFLATAVLTAPLVLALGTDTQRADLLPRIAAGCLTCALAAPTACLALTGDNRGDWAGGGRAGGVQARRSGAEWLLYGEADRVLDGHSADLLLVAAHTGGYARSRTDLFLVPGDADGLLRTRLTTLDQTRPQARVQLRDVKAQLLGTGEADIPAALARLGTSAATVLSCEAVGAAARALELTVDHTKQREQFGRPIASFQAVKHRLADVYVQVEAARSAAYYAAWAVGQGEPPAGEPVAPLALAQALEALRAAAAEAIQFHGGIGFTWEHSAQLYFKRAAGDDLLFGPAHRLRGYAAEVARLFEAAEVTV
ncbi:acyl-CoA dehydrogenase [Streptomyces sp. NBRC 14336]|uniref:acyl-CoA dehydrogenase family protein n=1 Tax=Streptomyces sp. NBRC 14336 TaxID=3030992 RepID=UPI0024A26676|nr:acyl-CoA dehydrogenase family protein [Streptomyces sp. NBRC 14336]GLW50930.1 acyl-CoA dehydrogenase [Streptomyces sp. NBRC 14336]